MKYIKLREHGPESKKPAEQWRKEENQYELDEVRGWLVSGHNIGLVCGFDDICVLDIDAPSIVDELGIKPYVTKAVKTGSGGWHLYYRIKNAKKVIIYAKDGTHLGELQATGQYVVAEDSTHPNGNKYRCVNPDEPILEVTQEELLLLFRGKCKLSDEAKPKPVFREFRNEREDELGSLRIEDVWDARVTEEGNGQLFAVHPIHGSSTKTNLVINPSKNCWKCFRCQSGGGVALAIAVKYGLIDCADAKPGALRGEKYLEVLRIAREKKLIKDPQQMITYDIRRCDLIE